MAQPSEVIVKHEIDDAKDPVTRGVIDGSFSTPIELNVENVRVPHQPAAGSVVYERKSSKPTPEDNQLATPSGAPVQSPFDIHVLPRLFRRSV